LRNVIEHFLKPSKEARRFPPPHVRLVSINLYSLIFIVGYNDFFCIRSAWNIIKKKDNFIWIVTRYVYVITNLKRWKFTIHYRQQKLPEIQISYICILRMFLYHTTSMLLQYLFRSIRIFWAFYNFICGHFDKLSYCCTL